MLRTSARRALGLVAAGLLLTACGGETLSPPEAEPTSMSELDAGSVVVPQIDFCELVDEAAVTAALQGEATADSSYGNGDEVALATLEQPDVVHEIGCTWERTDAASARAWIFARPVRPEFAKRLVELAASKGCTTKPTPEFAETSVLRTCPGTGAEQQQVRRAGLFGQTWLTCELQARGTDVAELEERTERWCVAVVNSLNTEG